LQTPEKEKKKKVERKPSSGEWTVDGKRCVRCVRAYHTVPWFRAEVRKCDLRFIDGGSEADRLKKAQDRHLCSSMHQRAAVALEDPTASCAPAKPENKLTTKPATAERLEEKDVAVIFKALPHHYQHHFEMLFFCLLHVHEHFQPFDHFDQLGLLAVRRASINSVQNIVSAKKKLTRNASRTVSPLPALQLPRPPPCFRPLFCLTLEMNL
jgi:hypothetical protein